MAFFFIFHLLFNLSQDSFELVIEANVEQNSTVSLLHSEPGVSGFQTLEVFQGSRVGEKHVFKGNLSAPNLYMIEVTNEKGSKMYSSVPFILNNGFQQCKLPDKDTHAFWIGNELMAPVLNSEYYKRLINFNRNVKWLESFTDSLSHLQPSNVKDSLLQVVENIQKIYQEEEFNIKMNLHDSRNPDFGLFPLWMIYKDIYENGYNEYHQYFYKWLSNEVKQSDFGVALSNMLVSLDYVKINEQFPDYMYIDLKTNELSKLKIDSEYTLVDFWFSGCGKCLAQFPAYMRIYDTTNRAKLEIITVSTDYRTSYRYLQEHRGKYKFKWGEYWDGEGVNAQKLGFSYFPKNVLLDKKGIVLYKNISPDELIKILGI